MFGGKDSERIPPQVEKELIEKERLDEQDERDKVNQKLTPDRVPDLDKILQDADDEAERLRLLEEKE